MTTLNLFTTLKEAFNASTINNNCFAKKLLSIDWDYQYDADGEHHFVIGNMDFSTPSLDPFKMTRNWRPSAYFDDGSYIEF